MGEWLVGLRQDTLAANSIALTTRCTFDWEQCSGGSERDTYSDFQGGWHLPFRSPARFYVMRDGGLGSACLFILST